MIGVTKLLCGATTPPDALRYRRDRARLPSQAKKPVVVWNMTRRCNLRCLHCYLDAQTQGDEGELTTEEGKDLLDDLAAFGAPVILFSGGEPLLREDLMDLGSHAVARGLRAVISTNGTLITESLARRIREAGFSYVGVSLDGIEATNDSFRGQRGAFAAALKGIRNCREVGVRTGLRLTLSRRNLRDLPAILDLLEEERIPRCCFYHLVYAGRAGRLREEDLGHDQTREALDLIFERARLYHRRGVDLEILTVDNHADGVYLYQAVEREDPERGGEVLELLRWNGGNSSGVGLGAVGPCGEVHADQFWQHYSFGNIRQRPFSEIWTDTSHEVMRGLKNRKPLLKGRCAACRHLDLCNGNLRVRAEAVYGDIWQQDPACYLTDAEIGLPPTEGRVKAAG